MQNKEAEERERKRNRNNVIKNFSENFTIKTLEKNDNCFAKIVRNSFARPVNCSLKFRKTPNNKKKFRNGKPRENNKLYKFFNLKVMYSLEMFAFSRLNKDQKLRRKIYFRKIDNTFKKYHANLIGVTTVFK